MVVYEDNDISAIVPDYLLGSDSLERDDILLSDEQQTEFESGEVTENGESSYDYSSQLDDISTLLTSLDTKVSSLELQVDNLNNNLIVLTDVQKTTCAFCFCICVFLVIKMAFAIINKILCFDSL